MRKIQIIITTGALLLGAVTAAGCSMFNSSGARTEETKSSVEQALAQGASESATESATESTKRTDLLPPQALCHMADSTQSSRAALSTAHEIPFFHWPFICTSRFLKSDFLFSHAVS